MAEGFCTARTSSQPFSLCKGGTATATLSIAQPVTLYWSDGTPEPYTNTGAGASVLTAYAGTPAIFDTTAYVWLVMAVKGTGRPVLAMEKDASTFSTLLGGTYARLYAIMGPSIFPVPQS